MHNNDFNLTICYWVTFYLLFDDVPHGREINEFKISIWIITSMRETCKSCKFLRTTAKYVAYKNFLIEWLFHRKMEYAIKCMTSSGSHFCIKWTRCDLFKSLNCTYNQSYEKVSSSIMIILASLSLEIVRFWKISHFLNSYSNKSFSLVIEYNSSSNICLFQSWKKNRFFSKWVKQV